ncbi:MAG: serine hydrolase, partial [Acidobacteria bacterium]|nr:serine hydrolase [Acidobacteriota bacterium]
MRRQRLILFAIAAMLAVGVFAVSPAARPARDVENDAKIDAIFARFTSATPGCAVGVSVDGKVVIEKAYGMADLEHDVPMKPDTIFEIGSASKQCTAAAVLLLARDGKL